MDTNQNSTSTPEGEQSSVIINPDQPKPADVIQPQSSPVPEVPKLNDVSTPLPATKPAAPIQPAVQDSSTGIPTPIKPDTSTLAAMPAQPKKVKSKAKMLIGLVALVVVLLGASAGAYFGIILPNKPENQLLSAFMHMAEQTQSTVSGKIDFQSKGEDKNVTVAIDYTMQANTDTKQSSLAGDIGFMGASLQFDTRYIDENIYLKANGLDSISKLMGDFGDEVSVGSLSKSLSGINNKWFVVDRSLMQSSKESKCLLDTSWKLNKDDINKIHKAYKKHPLFTVKGQSDASVNGTNTTKFELNATGDDVAKNFVKEVGAISVLENIKKCSGDSKTESLDNASDKLTKDQQKAQVFVYITKDKQIKKLEVIGEDEKIKFVINAEFSFGQVKIEKPEGATPIQELLGKFMGGELSTPGGLTDQSGTRLFDAISL